MNLSLTAIGVALLGVDALIIKWILGMMFISLETGSIASVILGGIILYFGGFAVIFFLGIYGIMFLYHGLTE